MSWSLCIVLTVLILSVTSLVLRWLEYRDARNERTAAIMEQWAIQDVADRTPAPPSPN